MPSGFLKNLGAQAARAVSGAKTSARSSGAVGAARQRAQQAAQSVVGRSISNADFPGSFRMGSIPAGPIGSTGRRSSGAGRATRGSYSAAGRAASRRSAPSATGRSSRGRMVGGSRGPGVQAAADVTAPRRGMLGRSATFAKKHPFMIGGMGVALGYNAGNQNTGPGVTTTNTTGVYQY